MNVIANNFIYILIRPFNQSESVMLMLSGESLWGDPVELIILASLTTCGCMSLWAIQYPPTIIFDATGTEHLSTPPWRLQSLGRQRYNGSRQGFLYSTWGRMQLTNQPCIRACHTLGVCNALSPLPHRQACRSVKQPETARPLIFF